MSGGTSPGPLVSVVVLSHRRPRALPEVLRSLAEQSYGDCEIIVVDNKSDASEEIAGIVAGCPAARLVPLDSIIGFSGGMTSGIAEAKGTYIFLTLDDLVVEPECIREFVDFFAAGGSGVATGLVLDSATNKILSAGGELKLNGVFQHILPGRGEPVEYAERFTAPYQVGYVPGGFIFCETATLRRFGGYRPEFFIYFEDVELSLRLRRLGYPLWVVPGARVWHCIEQPGEYPDFSFYKLRNFFATYILHARKRVWPEFLLRHVVLEFPRALRRGNALKLLAACASCAWSLPRLLRDRMAIARAAAAAPDERPASAAPVGERMAAGRET